MTRGTSSPDFATGILACVGLFAAFTPALLADGGAIQSRQESGPFVITVFTSPAPLRAGPVDMSVLVQNRDTLQTVLDAAVSLHLQRADSVISVPATRALARNKLLYAANVDLAGAGEWQYSVTIIRGDFQASVSGRMIAAPAGTKLDSYLTYFAFPPLCIVLFGIHQWLGRRHR